MKAAIIAVAGISSRFNKGVPEAKKELKAIYTEHSKNDTLLFHLLKKCSYADKIIVVGGYKFEDLEKYCSGLDNKVRSKIILVYNKHYEDLSSGYSLYLGLEEAFKYDPEDIVFVEGDLDVDDKSFKLVVESENSVLTYSYEPIYANKSVVLYQDDKGLYKYAFNSNHGMLSITSPFSCILNSGQIWKFTEMEALRAAYKKFYNETRDATNLQIIQSYLDAGVEVEVKGLSRWTNCNTKDDYRKIITYWEEE